jgi:hypothetical protein
VVLAEPESREVSEARAVLEERADPAEPVARGHRRVLLAVTLRTLSGTAQSLRATLARAEARPVTIPRGPVVPEAAARSVAAHAGVVAAPSVEVPTAGREAAEATLAPAA